METEAAIRIEHKELVTDSGGSGMHRGGAAQEIKLRNTSSKPMYVSLITERTKIAPRGLFGGGDGMRPKFELEDGTPLNPKGIHVVKAGEALIVRSHGGGGYGDPKLRAPAVVADDLLNGYVSGRQR
jgi:N-methylhydantoinase B